VVPFEILVTTNGSAPAGGSTITFTMDFATKTTAGDAFGYDPTVVSGTGHAGILTAFVDPNDTASVNTGSATVQSVTTTLVHPGTANEAIEATFTISGLLPNSQVVVEPWLVLDGTLPS